MIGSESKHREFLESLYQSKVRHIEMNATAVVQQPTIPSLGPLQDDLLARVTFVYVRGIYLPVRMKMAADVSHMPSSELKPSCVKIAPITRIGLSRSSAEQLAEWCNNLAIHVGVHQPNPARPLFYHCSPTIFTRPQQK